jgi:dihydroneopterin aldolase
MEFFSYHGYHAAERTIGNRYRVDIELDADFGQAAIADDLTATVNYEKIFAVVRDRMHIPARLLEHLAYEIVEGIREAFPQVKRVQAEVIKFNPPLGGVCLSASVVLQWPEK